MKPTPVTTRHYDSSAHPLVRALGQDLRFRCIPIGFFGGGPNLKFLLKLIWLHYFETGCQNLKIRLEPYYPKKQRASRGATTNQTEPTLVVGAQERRSPPENRIPPHH